MEEPTPRPNIDKERLSGAEAASLTRLAFSRERLTSQLYAASWHVAASTIAATEGDITRARDEAKRAADLAYAALGTTGPILPLLQELGVSNA